MKQTQQRQYFRAFHFCFILIFVSFILKQTILKTSNERKYQTIL